MRLTFIVTKVPKTRRPFLEMKSFSCRFFLTIVVVGSVSPSLNR